MVGGPATFSQRVYWIGVWLTSSTVQEARRASPPANYATPHFWVTPTNSWPALWWPRGNMPRMEIFLLWATLGIYAVGVIAVILAALFVAADRFDALHSTRPDDSLI